METCPICNKQLPNKQILDAHIFKFHADEISPNEYDDEYEREQDQFYEIDGW